MLEVTITIPDDLRAELQAAAEQEGCSPAQVIEAALREYLERRRLRQSQGGGEVTPARKPFWVAPIDELDGCIETDVSVNHDRYIAEAWFAEREKQNDQ